MRKELLLVVGLIASPMMVAPAVADDTGGPQTIVQYKVDIANVAVGHRASKIIGTEVRNEAGDKIGTVDDLIVTRNDRVLYGILSVGGFLGVGDKLVAVPYASLQLKPDHLMLANATKDSLKAMPKFVYAKN